MSTDLIYRLEQIRDDYAHDRNAFLVYMGASSELARKRAQQKIDALNDAIEILMDRVAS